MNVRIIKGTEITAPTTTPLNSSVLDHATVVPNGSFGLRNNEGLWPSYNCLDTIIPTPMCPDPLLDGFKDFGVAGWTPGFEFALYGGVQCSAVGLDKADQEREIARVFGLNVGKGIEQVLAANRFVATDPGDPVQWDAPVEVLGAPAGVAGALGALEGYAASVYAGQPTLHLPRAVVTVAFGLGLLTERDGKFYTKAGAKVAAGGGYDSTTLPLTGSYDLYATGEVYVEKSEQFDIQSIVIPGDGSGIESGENGLADNTVIGLAEQMFRVGIDCFVAKATATAWS